jgi:hypothetical protein
MPIAKEQMEREALRGGGGCRGLSFLHRSFPRDLNSENAKCQEEGGGGGADFERWCRASPNFNTKNQLQNR